MRIRWNDEVVQEMLPHLDAVQTALQEAVRRAAEAEKLLDRSNPDRDNRALGKMQAQLAAWISRLRQLQEATDEFRDGVATARQLMEQAEADALRLAKALPDGHGQRSGVSRAASPRTAEGAHRETFVMPTPRTGRDPYPNWLLQRAEEFDRNSFHG